LSSAAFAEALKARGVRVSGGAPPSGVRMVAHRHIDDAAIDEALTAVFELRS
jgi:hypothetical protein